MSCNGCKIVARRDAPPISGFYLFPEAVPASLQHSLALSLAEASTWPSDSNQVMLFDSSANSSKSNLPACLDPLVDDVLPRVLATLPDEIRDVVFDESKPRQCILNLYHPGQGISPHVDLVDRYEDAIVGVSLVSSTVMDLIPVDHHRRRRPRYAVRLKPGDVYVLSGEARYDYLHGIAYRTQDVVVDDDDDDEQKGETTEKTRVVTRGIRMSITLRRMRPGADVIGPLPTTT